MESEDDNKEEPRDFVETLKDLMRSWRWPEWQIDQELPKLLEVCEGVGMIVPTDYGYEVTARVTDPAAWEAVNRHLKELGLVGGQGS